MSYPTGMNMNTGAHYNKVAGQMQAYLHNSSRQAPYQSPYYSPYSQQEELASQLFQYGAQRMGVPPMIANELGGFARNMMRNVLS